MNLNVFERVFGMRGGKKEPITYEYDVVIIGSGMAGLYAAYNLKNHAPQLSFRILEKHKKQWVGGRTSNETFYGTPVVTGAGIGRRKDRFLRKLLRELDFNVEEFKVTTFFSRGFKPVDVNRITDQLRNAYQKYDGPSTTFKKFAKPILGDDIYERFLISSGYRDYEKEDIFETLYHYGMEDNACCLPAFRVQWRNLVIALMSVIGESKFHFSMNVTAISEANAAESPYRVVVETENGRKYHCKRVIVATTITSIRNLLPHSVYRDIEGQPFARVYGKFAKLSIPIMKEYVKGYTCVPGPLQKIIPIDPDNGVYMIAYNDNDNAVQLKPYGENTEENRDYYCRLIERTLGIPIGRLRMIGIRSYYWGVGTHYYKPLNTDKHKDRDDFLKEAQKPEENILVVGEVVSTNQGWVEGALESVANVVTHRWMARIGSA